MKRPRSVRYYAGPDTNFLSISPPPERKKAARQGGLCRIFLTSHGTTLPPGGSCRNDITKRPSVRMACLFYWMPGSSLLSHGETPHYHRRYGVSLLSSAWGQVGPPRSCRQANLVARNESFMHILRYFPHAAQSHTCVCSFSSIRSVPCLCTKSFVSADS